MNHKVSNKPVMGSESNPVSLACVSSELSVRTFDLFGREALQQELQNHGQQNIAALPGGWDTIHALTSGGKEYSGKFLRG